MGMALGMVLMLFLAPTTEAYWSVDYTITGARTSWTGDSIPGLGLPTYLSYTFSAGPTSVQTDACPPGYYSNDDAQTCIACPAGKYRARTRWRTVCVMQVHVLLLNFQYS
jgi:hypothetical protein